MNSKTKIILVLVITVLASAIILGLLLYPIISDKEQEPQGEKTEAETTEPAAPTANSAPDFTVFDMSGKEISLSDKKGRPTVVNFWASWCPPCVGELPHFDKMYEKYGDEVEFMMVNLTDGYDETKAKVQSFIDDKGYSFPVYLDLEADAAVEYKISSIPLTVFIDENGNIVKTKVGAMDEETLEGYILNLLGE